jgi:hypothetical protein
VQITQQVDEQTEGPPLTLTAVSGQSISLTADMLKVRQCRIYMVPTAAAAAVAAAAAEQAYTASPQTFSR